MTGKELFDLENELLKGPQERRVQVAYKVVEVEHQYVTVYANGMEKRYRKISSIGKTHEIQKRYIIVYGTDDTGYIAAYEDWFGALEEFLAVRFTTPIYDDAQSAYDDALVSALKEAEHDGFTITV